MQPACRTHLASGCFFITKRVTKQSQLAPMGSKRCNRLAAHTWPAAIFYYEAKRSNKAKPIGSMGSKRCSQLAAHTWPAAIFYYGVGANCVRGELCSPAIQGYHGESAFVYTRIKSGRTQFAPTVVPASTADPFSMQSLPQPRASRRLPAIFLSGKQWRRICRAARGFQRNKKLCTNLFRLFRVFPAPESVRVIVWY